MKGTHHLDGRMPRVAQSQPFAPGFSLRSSEMRSVLLTVVALLLIYRSQCASANGLPLQHGQSGQRAAE
jgi:hypothetical protein